MNIIDSIIIELAFEFGKNYYRDSKTNKIIEFD